MIETLLGLPAHPLIVHAAVVFAPLLVALVVAYSLVPAVRKWTAWAVLGLAVAAPLALWAAKLSGDAFLQRRIGQGALPEFVQRLQQHQNYGELAAYAGTALGVLALLLVYACTAAGRKPATTGSRAVTYGTIVLSLAAAAVTGYYIFQAGHSGANSVWGV
ncbi:DUF2231 domain-containing protein [Allorhizocola rhizosphaerae]|uniref:DUF2231 domain-containing protein n=1 Tax=Allorhizocola rhizosphaerae TaxID=1872709 RepID=UPI000E3EAFBC|nr:DUF2231 domain-containing protein [Allorhizocola rhizosphaerae]